MQKTNKRAIDQPVVHAEEPEQGGLCCRGQMGRTPVKYILRSNWSWRLILQKWVFIFLRTESFTVFKMFDWRRPADILKHNRERLHAQSP